MKKQLLLLFTFWGTCCFAVSTQGPKAGCTPNFAASSLPSLEFALLSEGGTPKHLRFAYSHEFAGFAEEYNIRNPKLLAKFLPEDLVIIEAGAYQGRDTLQLMTKYPQARIYAFEPLPGAFLQLEMKASFYTHISVYNCAIDRESGIKPFYICHGTYAENPIFEFHSSLLKPTAEAAIHLLGPIIEVPCISLADFCAQEGISQIDMLWLSTEGNELQILQGAGKLIDDVTLIYVRSQLYPTREGISLFRDIEKFMRRHGFMLLSHFYLKDIHGDALFIKQEAFDRVVHH